MVQLGVNTLVKSNKLVNGERGSVFLELWLFETNDNRLCLTERSHGHEIQYTNFSVHQNY